MSKLKILVVNDFASTAYSFERYLTSEINAIYFGKEKVLSLVKNPIFFTSNDFISQINQIKELSSKYDLFIPLGWLASAICYLAGVNYIMYFVDAYIEPKDRIRKKMPFYKRYFLSKLFEDTLQHANRVVAGGKINTEILKQYRKDVKQILIFTNPEIFNPQAKKIDLGESKFTFFSPARIEEGKGQILLWDVIKLTRSDFVVLQTDWGTGEYYQDAMTKKPEKVKIIPKIRREDMPSYYVSSDAVLGQIGLYDSSSIERESILCGKTVFSHTLQTLTDDEPFYNESKSPLEMAKYIDRIVEDKNFREELARNQSEWVKKTFDNKHTASNWEEVFEEAVKKKLSYRVKTKYKVIFKILSIVENLIHRDL